MSSEAQAARPSVPLALLFASIGGYVDALGLLGLGSVLVAHMSGDTASAAAHAAQGAWAHALHRFSPIPGFLAGAALARALLAWTRARQLRPMAFVLSTEAVLLAATLAVSGASATGAAMLAAAAMATQSIVVRHVLGHRVETTFVTGMLVRSMDELVEWWTGLTTSHGASPGLHLSIWLAFASGALLGAWAWEAWHLRALGVVIALLALLVLRDCLAPAP